MKKRIIVLWVVVFILFLFFPGVPQCISCSTFVLKSGSQLLFGRNWDHYSSKGLMIVNKRDVAKTALLMPPERPARWVSKYGSLTFNQIGKEFPYGGMNEKGLVVEMMWLEDTRYPEPDERPALMEVQWIQYQLDNFSTVEEVLQSQSRIRISQTKSKLHYLVCDRSGNAATIEFIDGECVTHSGQDLPVEALTNDTYDSCLELFKAYQDFDWEKKVDHTTLRSRDRFVKIARRIEDLKSEDIRPSVEYAFDILSSVGVGKVGQHRTAWSIVYDIKNLQIHFKTFENRKVRVVRLSDFDFSCGTPSRVLDITQDLEGAVSGNFVEYTSAINRNLIETVFGIYKEVGFIQDVSEFEIFYLANYPDMLKCDK
ncbi:MAG: linear amide C-N hydrolase [Candidatus Aminicenantes bacterium]|nr:linear amide C-N hydrolase [Candidatus Aminicenantes bacterium]